MNKSTISRRSFLKSVSAGLGVMALGGCVGASQSVNWATPGGRKPNILFIFSDDHACNAIGAYGSKINKTPNIDRIANEGAIFLHNTCCNSICAPSRAAVLTGKHSHKNGKKTNIETFNGGQQTFPKLLQAGGYRTAFIGKWHLGTTPTGFDHWDILPGQGSYYNPDFITKDGKRRVKGYNTDIVTDLALDWMKDNSKDDKPFMLMCQYKAPHRIWAPALRHINLYEDVEIPEPDSLFEDYSKRPEYFRDNEMTIAGHLMYDYDLKVTGCKKKDKLGRAFANGERRRMTPEQLKVWDAAYEPRNKKFYDANPQGKDLVKWKYQRYIKDYIRTIAAVDENIGRLLEYLEKTGQAENTIVFYSSDQSFYLGEHGMYDKRWMYEESMSMPLVMRWPGKVRPGTKIEQVTQNIDFAPTLLEVAGLPIPADIQGRSLLPLLAGRTKDWRKSVYYHYYERGEHNVPRHEGVRTDRYKLISFYDYDAWELYDLKKDPGEMKNVYDDPAYSKVVKDMKAELARVKKHYDAPEMKK